MSRNYGQYCGLARALDVVGDRWNLLIVRQLLIAPARYRQLADGLPGIATNLLAARLRDLEKHSVIERRLDEDGANVLYALTAWGAQLREPIESLIRWSAPLMMPGPGGDHFRAEWLVVALPALLAGREPSEHTTTVGIAAEGGVVQILATPTGTTVSSHDGRNLDAVITADPPWILGLAAGALTLDNIRDVVHVDGEEAAIQRVFGGPIGRT